MSDFIVIFLFLSRLDSLAVAAAQFHVIVFNQC